MKLKTIEEIKKSIEKLRKRGLADDCYDDEKKEILKKIAFRQDCIAYLDTQPTADYVAEVKERLKSRILEISTAERHSAKKDVPRLEHQLSINSYILD